jgi:CRP/FNR family transcriptional regulator, polysaccharide utilization system transcription regulator
MSGHNDCLKCKAFPKSVFSCLDKNSIVKLISSNSSPLSFKKGQTIYKEKSIAKGVFCIQHGKVKIHQSCHSRSVTTSLEGESDIIGYAGVIDNGHYANSATCLEDSQICFLPKKVFLGILASEHELQYNFLKKTIKDNVRLTSYMKELKCSNMLGRVVGALLEINKKFGVDENKCLDITITRKEISEMAGTTTESAIRILNELRREKVIAFLDNRIKIIDYNKLKKNRFE